METNLTQATDLYTTGSKPGKQLRKKNACSSFFEGFFFCFCCFCTFGPVYTTLKKFENSVFTLKTHHILSVYTGPEKLKTQQKLVILDLCEQNSGRQNK